MGEFHLLNFLSVIRSQLSFNQADTLLAGPPGDQYPFHPSHLPVFDYY
jgi:hypothetical protein